MLFLSNSHRSHKNVTKSVEILKLRSRIFVVSLGELTKLETFSKIGLIVTSSRSSHQRCSIKESVLKIFTKFTGKHLCQACNFIKKEILAQVFSCEFCEIFKSIFFYRTHLVTVSVINIMTKRNSFPTNTPRVFQVETTLKRGIHMECL